MEETQKATKRRELCFRGLFYCIGLLTLAVGIILNTKAGLGVSAIISVPYCVSLILHFNFGNMTFIMYVILVLIQFLVKGKDRKWADLLQLGVSIIFTRFLNLFGSFIPSVPENDLVAKVIVLLIAVLLTGIGAAMSVNARLVPNPGDGIVSAIADRTGKDLGFIKNCVDLTCILITVSIGLITEHRLVGIGIGTVVSMIAVGRFMWLYNKLFKEKVGKLSGILIYDGHQADAKTSLTE